MRSIDQVMDDIRNIRTMHITALRSMRITGLYSKTRELATLEV